MTLCCVTHRPVFHSSDQFSTSVGRFRLCSRHPAYAPLRRRAPRARFGGGMRQSRLPPTQGERRKATIWGFQGSWSRLFPWPRLPPPARRCIKDRTRVAWVGGEQPVWVAREGRALGGPTTKAASLDEAPVLSGSLLPTRGLGGARAAPTATQSEARNFRQASVGRFRLCSRAGI